MKLRAQIEEAIYETKIAINQAKKANDPESVSRYLGCLHALAWTLESRDIKDMPFDLPYILPEE